MQNHRGLAGLPMLLVVLLHGALVLRVSSDLLGKLEGQQWGGLLNGAAIALFLVNTLWAVRSGNREAGKMQPVKKQTTQTMPGV